mmetsp:Transcript_269/g.499  ORF Transcript_269/g.499 Transcript_269/m.499 type:complete len:259 (-) Transcript_269:9-785(-)
MIKLVPSEGAALGTSVGLTEGMVVGALLGAGETVGARDGVSLGAAVGGSVFRMHRLLHEDLAVVNTSIQVLRDTKTPSIRIRNYMKYKDAQLYTKIDLVFNFAVHSNEDNRYKHRLRLYCNMVRTPKLPNLPGAIPGNDKKQLTQQPCVSSKPGAQRLCHGAVWTGNHQADTAPKVNRKPNKRIYWLWSSKFEIHTLLSCLQKESTMEETAKHKREYTRREGGTEKRQDQRRQPTGKGSRQEENKLTCLLYLELNYIL